MAADTRPNIIWFMVDQMRAQAQGHCGDPNVSTPNLDRLAHEGVEFPRALSGTPICCPARGAMMTGRYPHRSSVAGHHDPLDPEMGTVAKELHSHGYDTCYVGKWHLDGDRPDLDLDDPENAPHLRLIPRERRGGFKSWFGFEMSNRPFDTYINVDDEDGVVHREKLQGYQTDALTEILIDWLTKRQSSESDQTPFFAVLSVEPPHNPYTAPADNQRAHVPGRVRFRENVPNVKRVRDLAGVELAGYYAAIERVDWNLGRLREALERLGLDGSTYIMFFSDHGDMHGSHGQFRKTAPWEESIRVPMIVGGPPREHQYVVFQRADSLINHVDIAPTTLGICGVEKPDWMDGFDYSGRICGSATRSDGEPDSAYLSLPKPTRHMDSIDREFRGVVTKDNWKYVCLEGHPWMLFDLNEDPYEQVNLAFNTYFDDRRRTLNAELAEWIKRTGDSFEVPELPPVEPPRDVAGR